MLDRAAPLIRISATALRWLLAIALASTALGASATNQPCSGKKGGVSHCAGSTFVCNDGSISGSKKACSMSAGGRSEMTISPATDDCLCRNRQMCVGPRGGVYCYSDSGAKSYRRN
ncbi:conserved hypothetical protein [Leptothrix cholodnii SP-6]|uniref:Uncharacterized protein n=1 Tax=Leptothrix cholodnii (strain ATCC 51168 / LMG 8142 / SP-6) TaxID=395495 RepID=B1XZH7_LEPCP|nr:hypothetical protein [Leptothrix cholodnii]ACB36540.1 conserved hypothetical protein [Leptothrix cholodnii SP-6]